MVILLALFIAGCGSKPDYPPNLSFPSRTDRLVLKTPEKPPAALNVAGKLVDELAQLDDLGGKTADPSTLPKATRDALDQKLKDIFGTPGAPKVAADPDADALAAKLGLNAEQLTEGSRLFRKQCLQCHNMTGDGRGPAGLWVVPFPRDFRRGVFKFTTTGDVKPCRLDLLRTLEEGLKGTAMPSFSALPDSERSLLACYVTYLSVRGQTEFESLAAALGASPPVDVAAFATSRVKPILAEWERAETTPLFPGALNEPDDGDFGNAKHLAAVGRGYALFTAKADNSCISCHGEFGRKPVLRYDIWGTVARPADLTTPHVFKGGEQPDKLFARIRGGIPAVGMPAHPELNDRQVWDLVRFVQSIPYPVRLPPELRATVGGNP